jgi:hypothetical protein
MANAKPKLNARGYDVTRPVPWKQTGIDGTTNFYTYAFERYDEKRQQREHRVQHALLWTKSQPSTATDEAAANAGIGNWVIINDETAQQVRQIGLEIITKGGHLTNPKQHFALLQQLQFVQLPRDLQGAQERESGILDGTYVDLPVTSVRNIRLRVHVLERKLYHGHTDYQDKNTRDLIRRALKIAGCGVQIQKVQGKTTTHTITQCRTKSCGQPECSLKNYYHKRSKYRSNLKSILEAANTNKDQYRIIHVTFTNEWALPKNESKRQRAAPIMETSGRKAKHIYSALHDTSSQAQNMYLERLQQHLTTIRKALDSTAVRKHVISAQHRVTEVAFLCSDHENRRSFPNPHTHAVLAVHNATTDTELVEVLRNALKQTAPFANVKLKDLHYTAEQDRQEQASALGAYDAKEQAITPAVDEAIEAQDAFTDEELQFMKQLGLGFKPHSTEVYAALDDKSLAELIEAEDYDNSCLYHSDVKNITHKGAQQQVITIRMSPVTKPLGKDKGKVTHTRRLLFYFSPYKNKVTKARVVTTEVGKLENRGVDVRAADGLGSGSSRLEKVAEAVRSKFGELGVGGSSRLEKVAEAVRPKAVELGVGGSSRLEKVAEAVRPKAVELGVGECGVATHAALAA